MLVLAPSRAMTEILGKRAARTAADSIVEDLKGCIVRGCSNYLGARIIANLTTTWFPLRGAGGSWATGVAGAGEGGSHLPARRNANTADAIAQGFGESLNELHRKASML